MQQLSPGANLALNQLELELKLDSPAAILPDYAGLVWLGFNEQRQLVGEPHYLHSADRPSIKVQPDQSWRINLAELPADLVRLQLCLYSYSAAGPVSRLARLDLELKGIAQYGIALAAHTESALLVLEFYRRNASWKVRALAEGSAYGLAALGRRLNLNLNEASPHSAKSDSANAAAAKPERWTGSAFAVDPWHVLTCQHVIDEAGTIELVSFAGRKPVQLVVADQTNDLALLRLQEIGHGPVVSFRAGLGCQLGELVTSMGFPLVGVTGSGLQVTQGCVSGLFGRNDDCRWLQFTAPIQPGSSGGPLFDQQGLVAGIITSTVLNAQNLNFAIKTPLILAFLEAAGLTVQRPLQGSSLTTPELIRQHQAGLWRVECRA